MRLGRLIAAATLFALLLGRTPGEIFYPWRDAYIGALDGSAWPGLVLAPNRESAFAFTLRVEKDGQTAESEDFFYLVSEVGPQAPDGQYARVRFDMGLPFNQEGETPILIKPASKSRTLTVEWSRRDEETVVGRILAPPGVRLEVVHYWPWDSQGSYKRLEDGHVRGESSGRRKAYYYFWMSRPGDEVPATGPGLALSVSTEKRRDLHFACGIGDTEATARGHLYRFRSRSAIDDVLEQEAAAYQKKRARVRGLFEGCGEAITNNLFWMVLYQPGQHRLYTPAGRRWIFRRPDGTPDHWQIFEWDSFFNALELAVESPKHAVDAVTAVLRTQYANGNIPNWRSRFGGTPDRSQPPIGSYVVLKLFQRLGDMDLLRMAYPYLEKWHAFWTTPKPNGQARRDGNGDGLLEWGSDS
ncbi:MAG: trehalase family glycosidase, partial [Candidatus Aminicenantes bacterium]|nr:trehalase family glycosidase [Candidatus Aminicenantes bacterium]